MKVNVSSWFRKLTKFFQTPRNAKSTIDTEKMESKKAEVVVAAECTTPWTSSTCSSVVVVAVASVKLRPEIRFTIYLSPWSNCTVVLQGRWSSQEMLFARNAKAREGTTLVTSQNVELATAVVLKSEGFNWLQDLSRQLNQDVVNAMVKERLSRTRASLVMDTRR